MYLRYTKPFLDYFAAAVLLTVSFPVWLVIILLLWYGRVGRIFFIQIRPGLNGELFPLIKFRSMIDLYDDKGNLLSDEKRVTKIGRLLRSTSLDELPQLINVLRGEMSLIGPRPLLSEYLNLYSAFHIRRNEVKPGITGWTQVNGRNAISWTTKLDLDIEYVENLSLSLDVKIIFTTLFKVISARDINATNCSSTPKFSGYR